MKLNEYFQLAKDQKPLVSEQQARNLVSKPNIAPSKNSYTLKPERRIKPLHVIGTSIASAAAVGIIYVSLMTNTEELNRFSAKQKPIARNNTEQTTAPGLGGAVENLQKPTVSANSIKENIQHQNNDNFDIAYAEEEMEVYSEATSGSVTSITTLTNKGSGGAKKSRSMGIANPVMHVTPKPVSTKFDIDGINVLELSHSDLKSMGVELVDNKTMAFSYHSGFDHPFAVELKEDRSFSVKFDMDSDDKNQLTIAPRLITDEKGNKKINLSYDEDKLAVLTFYKNNKIESFKDPVFKRTADKYIADLMSSNKSNVDLTSVSLSRSMTSNSPSNSRTLDRSISRVNPNILVLDIMEELKSYWRYYHFSEQFYCIIEDKLKSELNKPMMKKLCKIGGYGDSLSQVIFSKFQDLEPKIAAVDSGIASVKSEKNLAMSIQKSHKRDKSSMESMGIGRSSATGNMKMSKKVYSYMPDVNRILYESLLEMDAYVEQNQYPTDLDECIQKLELQQKMINNDNDLSSLVKINKLIPVAIRFNQKQNNNQNGDVKFFLWFDPSSEFLRRLPKHLRDNLDVEMDVFHNQETCNNPDIEGLETYLDVWRSCSGSIEDFKVYPNPARSRFNINFLLTDKRNLSISLHDLSGRKIRDFSTNKVHSCGEYRQGFSLENIASGIYLLAISTDKGEKAVQRLIIE